MRRKIERLEARVRLDLVARLEGMTDAELDALATGTNRLAAIDGNLEAGLVQVGQSLNVLNNIAPCQEIVETIIQEARATLASAASIEL